MNTVVCPHCKKEVEITQALKHELTERERTKLQAEFKKELEATKIQAITSSEKKIKEQFALEIKLAKDATEEKDNRIQKLIDQITQLTRDLSQSKVEKQEAEMVMRKKLADEESKIRLDARSKAEDEQRLLMLAKDKQLTDMLKELEDAKRKLEQGSQQTQGEVYELEFEEILRREFPHDKIKPVAKGVRGADIIQEVWDARGNYNGKILWELKNTKPPWKEDWVVTLKKNKREIGAEEAVLISEVLPKELKTSGYREGIWVTERNFVVGLASALRASLIQIFYVKEAAKGKDEKVEILYSYLSGVDFKHRIESIVESFTGMQNEIEKEKRYFSGKWSRDEKNLRRVLDNTFGMHGDFKHIMGNKLPEIKGFGEENADVLEIDDTKPQQSLLDD